MANGSTFEQLLQEFSSQAEAASAANLQRYSQAMAIYDEIVSRYSPGGSFQKRSLEQLEKQKGRTVGKQRQQLVSSGLYGTTTTAGLEKKWESEVGEPSRLRLEDVMMERLSQAQLGKAGFIERREDTYPDYGMMAQLAQMAGQGQGQGQGGGTFISGGGRGAVDRAFWDKPLPEHDKPGGAAPYAGMSVELGSPQHQEYLAWKAAQKAAQEAAQKKEAQKKAQPTQPSSSYLYGKWTKQGGIGKGFGVGRPEGFGWGIK